MRVVTILLTLGALIGGTPWHAQAEDWAQAGANPARTSHVADQPDAPYKIGWLKSWPGAVIRNVNQPIIVGGVVYVGGEGGLVYAVRASDGKELWSAEVGAPIMHALAGDGSRVYVAAFDGAVCALDARTGRPVWSRTLSRRGFSAAPLLMAGRLFIGNRDGVMYALSAKDGEPLWKRDTGDPIVQTAAGADGCIVFVNDAMKAFCLSADDGEVLWSAELPGRSVRDYWPVIHKGRVIIRTEEAVLRCKSLRLIGLQKRLYWPIAGDNQDVKLKARSIEDMVAEQDIFAKFFTDFPKFRTFIVLDLRTGKEPYTAGIVMGCRNSGVLPPPVVAGADELYTTFLTGAGDRGVVTITRAALGRVNLETGKIDRPIAGWGRAPAAEITGLRCPFELTSDETVTLASGGDLIFGIRTDIATGAVNVRTRKGVRMPGLNLPRSDDLLPTGNLMAVSDKYVVYAKCGQLICVTGSRIDN